MTWTKAAGRRKSVRGGWGLDEVYPGGSRGGNQDVPQLLLHSEELQSPERGRFNRLEAQGWLLKSPRYCVITYKSFLSWYIPLWFQIADYKGLTRIRHCSAEMFADCGLNIHLCAMRNAPTRRTRFLNIIIIIHCWKFMADEKLVQVYTIVLLIFLEN